MIQLYSEPTGLNSFIWSVSQGHWPWSLPRCGFSEDWVWLAQTEWGRDIKGYPIMHLWLNYVLVVDFFLGWLSVGLKVCFKILSPDKSQRVSIKTGQGTSGKNNSRHPPPTGTGPWSYTPHPKLLPEPGKEDFLRQRQMLRSILHNCCRKENEALLRYLQHESCPF